MRFYKYFFEIFKEKWFTMIEKRHDRLLFRYRLEYIDFIQSDLTKIEKMKLYGLSSRTNGVFVEIGSYKGASSCFIAKGIKDRKTKSTLYCIDTWKNDAMSEGYRDTFDVFKKNTAEFGDIICPIRGKSTEIAEKFSKKIDFLFIDGDHSYEGVKSDIDSWFPKLNSNALVIFHDIGWAEGVQKAVKEEVESRAIKKNRLKNLYWAWL
jgi:predicted O-methyltransferase YrrM